MRITTKNYQELKRQTEEWERELVLRSASLPLKEINELKTAISENKKKIAMMARFLSKHASTQ